MNSLHAPASGSEMHDTNADQYTMFYSITPSVLSYFMEQQRDLSLFIRHELQKARHSIQSLYPELTEKRMDPLLNIVMHEFHGKKQAVEEASLALASCVETSTRQRLLYVSSHQTGDEDADRKGERDYIANDALIIQDADADITQFPSS